VRKRWESILRSVPHAPGVYEFKDETGRPLYIGKAVDLQDRVRQYVSQTDSRAAMVRRLMKRAQDLSFIVTDSEYDALVLEANLIKQFRPHYNVMLKDDKSFPYVKLTREKFPRVLLTRTWVADKGSYWGPFTNVRDALLLLVSPAQVLRQEFLGAAVEIQPVLRAVETVAFVFVDDILHRHAARPYCFHHLVAFGLGHALVVSALGYQQRRSHVIREIQRAAAAQELHFGTLIIRPFVVRLDLASLFSLGITRKLAHAKVPVMTPVQLVWGKISEMSYKA